MSEYYFLISLIFLLKRGAIKESRQNIRKKARETFFRKIKSDAPEVLKRLLVNVFPLSESFNLSNDFSNPLVLTDLSKHFSQMVQGDFEASKDDSLRSQFESAFYVWASKYNLSDAWILYEALATLEKWKSDKNKNDWAYSHLPATFFNFEDTFKFTFEPFNADWDSLPKYEKKLRFSFETQLETYLENERRKIKDKKLTAFNYQQEIHFTWLIKHQLLGLSYGQLDNRNKNEERPIKDTTYSEGIKRIANLIDLTLRDDVPNR